MATAHAKSAEASRSIGQPALSRVLRWPQLIVFGVGAIVGTGIYTLIGVGAGIAGPSLTLAFCLAGALCGFALLSYAEMATMMPQAGGAYTYTYAGLGQIAAWIVGWSLILEYSVGCAAVAVGWSAYMVSALAGVGIHIPAQIATGITSGGILNLPAVLIVAAAAAVLCRGAKASARLNAVLVGLKIGALALFVVVALSAFLPANLTPFMPYGFLPVKSAGGQHGTLAAAAIVFFAFFGFDAVATMAEETRQPQRDVPRGLLGTMLVCVLIYAVVSLVALGAVHYDRLAHDASPLATIMQLTGHPRVALIISAAAIIALPAAIISLMYGQSRLFFAMARDGLLPQRLARIDAASGAPRFVTIAVAVFIATVAGVLPLDQIATLTNAGAITAFVAVPLAALALRRRSPERPRPFRAPAIFWFAPIAAVAGLLLLVSLPSATLWNFLGWNVAGLLLYGASKRWRRG